MGHLIIYNPTTAVVELLVLEVVLHVLSPQCKYSYVSFITYRIIAHSAAVVTPSCYARRDVRENRKKLDTHDHHLGIVLQVFCYDAAMVTFQPCVISYDL